MKNFNWLHLMVLLFSIITYAHPGQEDKWKYAWPNTDFTRATVDLEEIISGGPGKDGIPSIDDPEFVKLASVDDLADNEPVIGLFAGGEAKAYPLRVLIWHEIVNDTIGGTPVSVTYCPLCNTSIVFDRRLNGHLLDFGTTGNLRHSDLIMYDRQTESWWQQYGGEAIAGHFAGKSLKIIPSRLESLKHFRQRFPNGQVLVPNNTWARRYGANPYVGYDQSPFPFLYKGSTPAGIAPMTRVIAIDNRAFSLPLLRKKGEINREGLHITWSEGQNSSLDTAQISDGRDVGNVLVSKGGKDQAYVVTFAFAFFAFHPDGVLHTQDGKISNESSNK